MLSVLLITDTALKEDDVLLQFCQLLYLACAACLDDFKWKLESYVLRSCFVL